MSACRAAASLILIALALTGCGAYTVQGRVVQADFSTLAFVDADDPRLADRGLAGAEVKIYRDPTKPNTELIARVLSDADGNVSIPLGAFGAGWMIEQWRITAGRSGYQTADLILPLPGAGDNKRLLVLLGPGWSAPSRDDEDLMELYREYR